MKIYNLPTGYLFTNDYSRGQLETLSIGDYGKENNIKANFLGFTKEINGVPIKNTKPLSEKWVITLSIQYGCPMKCVFCDVPKLKFNGNACFDDLLKQFYSAIKIQKNINYTDRLNIHFARMGEPIFNPNVFNFAIWLFEAKEEIQKETNLRIEVIHPVLSTSLPKHFTKLEERLFNWIEIKNDIYNGQAGLQLSINSTSEEQRNYMFQEKQLPLVELSKIAKNFPNPLGRKYCLNFAFASDFEINANYLADLFDTDKFMCKITPIHNNNACENNKLKTIDGYTSYLPYKEVENNLNKAGFDTLVFVPSIDEEKGCITCGNAILAGSKISLEE